MFGVCLVYVWCMFSVCLVYVEIVGNTFVLLEFQEFSVCILISPLFQTIIFHRSHVN